MSTPTQERERAEQDAGGWVETTIRLALEPDSTHNPNVPAWTHPLAPGIAVHKPVAREREDGTWWIISHVPTGRRMVSGIGDLARAQQDALTLAMLGDWSAPTPDALGAQGDLMEHAKLLKGWILEREDALDPDVEDEDDEVMR